ncbi:DUF3151 domain-containing protein [Klugiella xanthotipulae]|uniref:Uncharacterized protein DUF3151 n=1 Tax=Klugiella xanthotipulae TaxID=244735 RepID=A0A543HH19_9MICO|nr:DUF3151 domain-containing protein [Klugiella xanthotipulae]TQM57635.1 uncharacterized protein DUF3151 [Klugiella xanthotipulae]
MTRENLLGVPPTLLPVEADVLSALDRGEPLTEVVRSYPASSLAWALLADEADAGGQVLPAYAYARVGYHRGLDALRGAGWKGHGPVPWSHEPNRGVLRSLYALRRGAERIGETAEVVRLTEFLRGADPDAISRIDEGE